MLSDNTKDKYGSLATFESMIESIYNSLSSNIFSYATEEDIYTIKMNEEKNIKIYENGIMDFKIEF